MSDYLHNHKDFAALLRIVGQELSIEPGLIEKDYWIMHVLYGLKQQGYEFELKGGTSLSKGYGIIHPLTHESFRVSPQTTATGRSNESYFFLKMNTKYNLSTNLMKLLFCS
tara:strand:+ start:304 stop:636 length:333 start_codon:yes stop_codon:yes gene_type:complete